VKYLAHAVTTPAQAKPESIDACKPASGGQIYRRARKGYLRSQSEVIVRNY